MAFYDTESSTMPTIRSSSCEFLLSHDGRCSKCSEHRRTLNAMLHRHWKDVETDDKCNPSSRTNYRYLNTPEKEERLHRLQAKTKVCQQRISYLRERVNSLIQERGIQVDEGLQGDLVAIMDDNANIVESHPPDSFLHIFWEQQHRAAKLHNSKSMKWEPAMIRWCLYLRHLSGTAYETLRSSGILKLPSQRTLRDYTYYTRASQGYSADVDKQLMDAANILDCPERERYIVLIMDEMHIREDIIYDKHTGNY